MWSSILALAKKEFLALWRDPRSRFILIVPPLFQLLIFGYAASYELERIPIAIYDQDRGIIAREFIAHLQGSPHFEITAWVDREAELEQQINHKQALLALVLLPRFSAEVLQGRSAPMQLIIDGRNSNTALIALSYIQSLLIDFNRQQAAKIGMKAPALLHVRHLYNQDLNSHWFIIPGIIGSLTLVLTLVVTALSIAREREQGTFDQLLVSPLSPTVILIGKALPAFIIAMVQASLIILITVFWFQIPLRGDLIALYLGLALFILSAIGIGLMISSLSVTQQQAVLGAFLFMVPAIILSGFATPIQNMPDWLQYLTYLNPMRYFLIIVRSIFLEGAGLMVLIHQYWPMLLIAVLCLASAAWLFRHRLY